ncbi:MAG: hypothetical protein ACOZF0_02580 [Thermodesulfobacteriota bacterium]
MWQCREGDCSHIESGEEVMDFLFDVSQYAEPVPIDEILSPEGVKCTLAFKGTLGREIDIAVIGRKFPLGPESVKLNEEWDAGLTGANAWEHTAVDDPRNYPNDVILQQRVCDPAFPGGAGPLLG